jgi:hypothetical protein
VVVGHLPPGPWLLESGLRFFWDPPQTIVGAGRWFPGSRLGAACHQAVQCGAMPLDKLALGNKTHVGTAGCQARQGRAMSLDKLVLGNQTLECDKFLLLVATSFDGQ